MYSILRYTFLVAVLQQSGNYVPELSETFAYKILYHHNLKHSAETMWMTFLRYAAELDSRPSFHIQQVFVYTAHLLVERRFKMMSVVPQGSVIWPVIFILFP